MNKLPLVILAFICCQFAQAQIKALTENGKEVALYNDGTWKYINASDSASNGDSISLSPHAFAKEASSSFLVKSNNVNVGVYINPAKWKFTPNKDGGSVPEYGFEEKGGEAYAMMIAEKTEIPLASFRQIALINAQRAAPDARVVASEYRMVNGKKILYSVMKATVQGIKFVYVGYYYSNKNGSVQLLGYTSEQVYPQMQKVIESFLNGFVEVEK